MHSNYGNQDEDPYLIKLYCSVWGTVNLYKIKVEMIFN